MLYRHLHVGCFLPHRHMGQIILLCNECLMTLKIIYFVDYNFTSSFCVFLLSRGPCSIELALLLKCLKIIRFNEDLRLPSARTELNIIQMSSDMMCQLPLRVQGVPPDSVAD